MLTRKIGTSAIKTSMRLFSSFATSNNFSRKSYNHQEICSEVNKAIDRNLSEWLKQQRELTTLKLEFILDDTSGLAKQKTLRKCQTHLSPKEGEYINKFIDVIRKNHGLRKLNVEDSWDDIAVVTYPEKAVAEQIAKEGKCLHEALLHTAQCMLPHLPCFKMQELFEVAFFKENLDLIDSEGNNALHRLLLQEGEVNIPVVQFLIDQGVSVKTKNAAGKTALDYIAERGLIDKTNISLDDRIADFLL